MAVGHFGPIRGLGAFYDANTGRILIDEELFTAPRSVVKFVVRHEKEHARLKHQPIEIISIGSMAANLAQEVAADKAAASQATLPEMLQAVKWLCKGALGYVKYLSYLPPRLRILNYVLLGLGLGVRSGMMVINTIK